MKTDLKNSYPFLSVPIRSIRVQKKPLQSANSTRKVRLDRLEHVLPTFRKARAMFRIDHPDRSMAKRYLCTTRDLVDLHLDMIQRRIRHEERPAQLDQHRRLDHLH